MALDFVITGVGGSPSAQVSLGAEAHHRLMQVARSVGSARFERLAEYYEDAEFSPDEAPALLREVETLLRRCGDDTELSAFLRSLKELVSIASAARRPITAVAD